MFKVWLRPWFAPFSFLTRLWHVAIINLTWNCLINVIKFISLLNSLYFLVHLKNYYLTGLQTWFLCCRFPPCITNGFPCEWRVPFIKKQMQKFQAENLNPSTWLNSSVLIDVESIVDSSKKDNCFPNPTTNKPHKLHGYAWYPWRDKVTNKTDPKKNSPSYGRDKQLLLLKRRRKNPFLYITKRHWVSL